MTGYGRGRLLGFFNEFDLEVVNEGGGCKNCKKDGFLLVRLR